MVLSDMAQRREKLKLMNLEYDVEDTGHVTDEPVVTAFCRNASGERRPIKITGFYPSFYVTESEFAEYEQQILTETMVRSVVAREDIISAEKRDNSKVELKDSSPRQTLTGRHLVRIYTGIPDDVPDLKELFNETWEADVFFTNRFLIDSDVMLGFSIPEGHDTVHIDEVEPLEASEVPEIEPRVHTVDIEVWSGGIFPDAKEARNPITAITAHDSYTDEYFCAILHPSSTTKGPDSWPTDPQWESPEGANVSADVYHSESEMVGHYLDFVEETDPDMLTGWNSSRNEIGPGFDYPYIINRARKINCWPQRMAAGTGDAFVTQRGSPVVYGREMFDMLQAYKKTQIHEKRSYSLEYIAQEELGQGKEDVADLDEGWLHEPVEFMKYNIRDTQAVFQIEESKGVIEMYDHIRSIAGATYSEIADSNIGIIDMLYLREAKKRGLALPTSTKPEMQYYFGAYVFHPKAGKHKNVVYPDLSSLYPNLFRDMNASPETIVGFEEDLEESHYTKEDCHVVYVDTRDEQTKRDVDEPERTELYVLKPEVKESFVRDVINDLIDMKYEYKSDEYPDEAYEAVKRITNSVYGCMGDSVSYGVGFRLFDWRIAEAITLAGRDVIKHTAEEFINRVRNLGYPNSDIVAGDTDSCVASIEEASGMDETLEVAKKAAKYVDMTYDSFMKERYNMDENNMAVEIESYAQSALFMDKKKRYAQWIRWDEGTLVDKVKVKGFEYVRSDSAKITATSQKRVIDMILKEDVPKKPVHTYMQSVWSEVTEGDIDLNDLGIPSKVNNKLMDYGWSIDDDTGEVKYFTPQPHIRGSRYASLYIEGEDIQQGSKPLMFYSSGVDPTSNYPETYDYDDKLSLTAPKDRKDANTRGMKEIGREVDAIAVDDVRHLPPEIRIDYEKMAEKTLRDPIEPITTVMGWDFDDLITEGSQTGLADFM